MNERRALLLLPLVLTLAAAGCATTAQTDCVDRCEAQRSAGCAPIAVSDCDAHCENNLEIFSRAGCADEYGATQRCVASGDVCDATARCSAETDGLTACVRAYCDTDPDDPSLCGP